MKSYTPILCAAISDDGTRLALCCKQNEIQILSVLDGSCGKILSEIKGDSGILDKICFLPDGSRLRPAWLQGECAQASDFCLSEDGSRLAIISYGKAHIVDLKSTNLTLSFELEHVVKRCEAKFENSNGSKNLAVRTDYGCFSLYRV